MSGFSLPTRWLNRLYAWAHAYFWLPCPICGEHFGGHESSALLLDGDGHGRAACMGCSAEVVRRNIARMR